MRGRDTPARVRGDRPVSGTSGVGGAVVAVVGTLAGVALTTTTQGRRDRATRRETRWREAVAAVAQLAAALAAHRLEMWVSEHARLSGASQDEVAKAREARHRTRNAIDTPLFMVMILAPTLTDYADAAVQATYAMRAPEDLAALDAARGQALEAHQRFVAAARVAVDNWDTARGPLWRRRPVA